MTRGAGCQRVWVGQRRDGRGGGREELTATTSVETGRGAGQLNGNSIEEARGTGNALLGGMAALERRAAVTEGETDKGRVKVRQRCVGPWRSTDKSRNDVVATGRGASGSTWRSGLDLARERTRRRSSLTARNFRASSSRRGRSAFWLHLSTTKQDMRGLDTKLCIRATERAHR